MKKLEQILIVILCLYVSASAYGQAALPVSRTAWGTTPTGWTDNGTGQYATAFACSGSDGGKMDNTGDYYKVFFSGIPNTVSFVAKTTTTPTSCSLLVEESPDGTAWTTVNNITVLSTTCTAYGPYALNPTSTYLRWTYTKSGSVNLTLDDVIITLNSCTPPADPAGSITVSANPSCGPATLSYPAGTAPVLNYWQTTSGGSSLAYPTSANYTLNATGTIYVRAYNSSASCWSSNAINTGTVTVNTPVSITPATPANQSNPAGSTATFTVSATGSGLSYQWQEDQGSGWNNIGTNSNSYTTPATTLSMNGWQYRCIVSGASPCPAATSNPATLTVYVPLSGGFSSSSGSVSENGGTYQIGVTVDVAPSTDLVLRVADAGTGTASPVTDYTYTTTDLTFPASGTYPQTQYATVTILNDGLPESNKYRNFSLTKISGPTLSLSPSAHQMTIVDDDVLEGVVLNEFSQGAGNAAYLELVVIGIPGTTVDLRGWIIDDNSGIFSGGYGTFVGIADGHIKFSNVCAWEKVPVGSIIVIYVKDQTGTLPVTNSTITSSGLADDPTDANLDYVYVVGVNFYNAGQCASLAVPNPYFSSDCDLPSNTSYDTYTPAVYANPDMGTVQFRNSGDAVQLRDQSGTYFMGLSYGSKGAGSNCASCAINAANHPDYASYGSNALYFSGTSNVTYAFQNTNDDDYRRRDNWTKTTSNSPNAMETPGLPNGTANNTWIQSLRANFDIVTDDENWTCALRQYESRFYLDAVDKIIFYIKNNANVDQGDLTAETYYYNTATVGRGFENDLIAPSPTLFVEKTWIGTPTNISPNSNYKIRFYVNNTELQNYCDYVNNRLDVFYNLPAGTINYTPATIIPKLYLYRTGGSVRAWTATSSVQVEKVMPANGTYVCPAGSYTYFEHDGFTAFSGYALGNEIVPNGTNNTLPVELTSFTGHCVDDNLALLNWNTASEMNSKEFTLERSADGIHFTTFKTVPAAGFSTLPRSYAAVDSSLLSNENYYRLSEVDNDGKKTIHSILLVRCSDVNGLQTYYSPGEGITVQLNSTRDKQIQFNLYEVSGKLLYRENIAVAKGYSRFTLTRCRNLANGIYILQTIDENQIIAGKILVH